MLLLLLAPIAALSAKEQEIHPVYVGRKACAACHQGQAMGQQFSQWLLSKHARAYASLAKPEAKKIAELSGIPQEPQKSRDVPGLPRHRRGGRGLGEGRDVSSKDGVQCEKCHGPGSEYVDARRS